MTHDDHLPGPVDASRIELVEDHELRYWTREFRCSAKQLLEAIESVGIDSAAVGEYIARRRESGAANLQYQVYEDAQWLRRGRRERHFL